MYRERERDAWASLRHFRVANKSTYNLINRCSHTCLSVLVVCVMNSTWENHIMNNTYVCLWCEKHITRPTLNGSPTNEAPTIIVNGLYNIYIYIYIHIYREREMYIYIYRERER